MATIKEMAQKASENYLGEAFEQGNFADWYIVGANAVLKEIEACLEEPSMIQGYSDILAKVQELKGE